MPNRPLVLASGSPRRERLLREGGLSFEVDPPTVAERIPADVPVEEAVRSVASQKARSVARRHPYAWVLAADTVGSLDGELMGKPADEADARSMLERLSGRVHEVWTGLAVQPPSGEGLSDAVVTRVAFHKLDAGAIEAYVATGESMDKAGAYAVQGQGRALVARLEGPYDNVVGLPVDRAVGLLKATGWDWEG